MKDTVTPKENNTILLHHYGSSTPVTYMQCVLCQQQALTPAHEACSLDSVIIVESPLKPVLNLILYLPLMEDDRVPFIW